MIAPELRPDKEVDATLADVLALVPDELTAVTPVVVTVPLGEPTTEHPVPMFPFLSVFNAHISALPALKEEVSPARIYPPSWLWRIKLAELLLLPS